MGVPVQNLVDTHIILYNITTIILQLHTVLAKFTFRIIVPYSTLIIGLIYLFYGKKIIAQFQKEKKMIGHQAHLR